MTNDHNNFYVNQKQVFATRYLLALKMAKTKLEYNKIKYIGHSSLTRLFRIL